MTEKLFYPIILFITELNVRGGDFMDEIFQEKTCCFFGHRKIDETDKLKTNLYEIIENLIVNEKVDTFLFGSKSDFDTLCLKITTELKQKYSHIRRVYVRAEYRYIDDEYKNYLLKNYDYTYYPESIKNSGRAAYVERNREMIINSRFCVVYYDEKYFPPRRKNSRRDLGDYQPKSGTAIAYEYAVRKKKKVINVF